MGVTGYPGDRRIKVAILGGGLGAVAAAFELTSTPERRATFQVTVYQQGWRLGGKGASGRNLARAGRIEEHGLHAFLGFYEHAFGVMRTAFDEWDMGEDYPFQTWRDAFLPQRQVTLQEELPGGGWSAWNVEMPRLPGEPGDGEGLPGLAHLLAEALRWVEARIGEALAEGLRLPRLARLVEGAERWFERELEELAAALLPLVERGFEEVLRALRAVLPSSAVLRRLRVLIELGCAVVLGLLRDVLPSPRGFDAINGEELRAWLARHGAPADVTWSAPVRALYDLGFAYDGGISDPAHATVAAGVAARVLLLLAFGYKDAPLWKMRAGMGDTIFTPLYEVLAHQRGVRFEFFQRTLALEPSPNGNLVETIQLSRQADLRRPYEPLVEVRGLRCWPHEPLWDFLEGGDVMAQHPERYAFESDACVVEVGRRTLRYGTDFDFVVLGIAVGALRNLTPELAQASPRWKAMLDASRTVQTQAMQLWLTPNLASLGWKAGTTILTGYAEPFDSWGDMTHLVAREAWPAGAGPSTIAYFCGALAEGDPATQPRAVKDNALRWLSQAIGDLWPAATAGGPQLDWSLLVDPSGASGPARFDAQFWRANVDGSERYVLSPPGTIEARLRPGDSDFLNLVVAGDWTRTSLDSGSADAAVESGLLAARAIAAVTCRAPSR